MQDFLKIFLVLLVAGVLYYLVFSYYKKKNNTEKFSSHSGPSQYDVVRNRTNRAAAAGYAAHETAAPNTAPPAATPPAGESDYLGCSNKERNFEAYDPTGTGEWQKVDEPKHAGPDLPKDCFPKDQLAPSELLPANMQSQWSSVNPDGQGKLGDQNFLSAGYHFGTDTVGQSLRNANRQLRSEPANPQVKVSPWLQTTIEPDINRRPLEIGGC